MKTNVYINGKPGKSELKLASLKAGDSEAFESFRTYGKSIFRLDEHLDRFEESVKTLGKKAPSRKIIEKYIQDSIEMELGEDPLFIRLMALEGNIIIFITSRNHSKALYEKGVQLQTSSVQASFHKAYYEQVKSNDYVGAIWASTFPKAEAVYEWIFMNDSGFVTESRIGNLFMVKNIKKSKCLMTPPTTFVLNGVTRRFVLECASSLGFQVMESPLTRHDLYNADEIFLTNTSWEILPVIKLDGRKIGSGKPGINSKQIHKKFKQKVEKECRKQK